MESKMPKKNTVETYHEDGVWKNKIGGNKRASDTSVTKAEAERKGSATAKKHGAEHVIKKMDGTIGEKNSYGKDPHPPKG